MDARPEDDAIRFLSPRLRALPWATNLVQRQPNLIRALEPNASAFRAYENHLLKSRHNKDEKSADTSTLVLLGLQVLPTVRSDTSVVKRVDGWNKETHEMTTHQATPFVSLLCAYRAADILARVKCLAPTFSAVLHPDRSIMTKPPTWFEQVEDVKSVLLDFRKAVQKQLVSGPIPEDNPTSAIIGSLGELAKTDKRTSIYRNLLNAALHLSVMAKGKFQASQVPDLWSVEIMDAGDGSVDDPASEFGDVLQQPSTAGKTLASAPMTNAVDTESLRAHLLDTDLNLAKLPLQVALAVSAIYLLLPHELQTAKFSRLALLKAFVAIGHGKDPRLLLLEDIIWRALIGLVEGTIRPSEIGSWLLDSIPWDVVESLGSESTSLFFCSNLSQVSSSQIPQSAAASIAISPSSSSSTLPSPSDPAGEPSALASLTEEFTVGPGDTTRPSNASAAPPLAPLVPTPNGDASVRRSARTPRIPAASKASSLSSSLSAEHTKRMPVKRKVVTPASGSSASKKTKVSEEPPMPEYRVVSSRAIVKDYAALLGTSHCPFVLDDEPIVDSNDLKFEYGTTAIKLETDLREDPKYHNGPTVSVWNCVNEQVQIKPSFHLPEDTSLFQCLYDHGNKDSSPGGPNNVLSGEPNLKTIRLHRHGDYLLSLTSTRTIGVELSQSCQVFSGMAWPQWRLRVQDLHCFVSLDATVSIIDFSVPSTTSAFARSKYCSMSELLSELDVQPSMRRNLLATGIPLLVNDTPFFEASTDIVAWVAVAGTMSGALQPIPVNRLLSLDVSTGDTILPLRFESNGFARHIDLRSGSAVLFVADDKHKFNSFLLRYPSLPENLQGMRVEHMLLMQGCRAVIPPNTPFSMCFLGPTVARVGRFYNIHCMQATLRGVIHSLVESTDTTGGFRAESRGMLRKMMHFVHRSLVVKGVRSDVHSEHLPNLLPSSERSVDMGEVLNFWILCALNIIANVADPRTYCFGDAITGQATSLSRSLFESRDVNVITEAEREEICLARALALDALDWYGSCFESTPSSEDRIDLFDNTHALHNIFVVDILRVILAYTLHADTSGMYAQDMHRYEDIESQVLNLIGFRDEFRAIWDIFESYQSLETMRATDGGLSAPFDAVVIHADWMACTVRRRERIRLPRDVSSRDGRTNFDELFRDWKRRKDTGSALLNTTFVL